MALEGRALNWGRLIQGGMIIITGIGHILAELREAFPDVAGSVGSVRGNAGGGAGPATTVDPATGLRVPSGAPGGS